MGLQGVRGEEVREADRQGVRGIGFRRFPEFQQGAHHEGDLRFLSGPPPYNGEFHAFGRVFHDSQPGFRRGDDHGRLGRPHRDGRLVGLDVDDAFHRHFIRFPFVNEVAQMLLDGKQAAGLGHAPGNGERSVVQGARPAVVALHHGIARVADGRVYGKDAHGMIFIPAERTLSAPP